MVADRGIAPPPYLTRALFALEDAEFPRTFCYVSEVVDGQQGVGVFAVTTGIQLRVFLQDVFQSGGSVSDVQLAVLLPGNPTVTLMTLPGGILGVSEHAMLSLLKCYFLVGVTARRM